MKRPWRLAPCLILLAGCAAPTPIPEDHFYRLPAVDNAPETVALTATPIFVDALRAEGLYRERPILSQAGDGGLELRQARYHFWHEPPATLLRDYLIEYLRAAGAGTLVTADRSIPSAVRVSGRIKALERRVEGDAISVVVALELRLDAEGEPTPPLIREYRRERPVAGAQIPASVQAFGEALNDVYREFLRDAAVALKKGVATTRD
jgi:ABC-type uncharacterized transport system auxiliary subunit